MKISFSNMTLEEIARQDILCECGTRHSTGIHSIRIGCGAIRELPGIVAEQKIGGRTFDPSCDKILLVEDENTRRAAGDTALALLRDAGFSVDVRCFDAEGLVARIENVETVEKDITEQTALLIAVGSGTLNDVTKYAAYRKGLPFYIVGTAPSMDGYASSVAPMLINGVKYALDAKCPDAIIGDIDIIREAPARLMSAGYGDIGGKCVSICDWKLSNIVNGEIFCEKIAATVLEAVERCRANIDGLLRRETEATQAVTEALVLCGLMMSYAKSSRPASGSEHNFGHIVEMMELFAGKEPSLHGEGVAVGSVLSCKLLRGMLDITPDRAVAEASLAAWDEDFWLSEIKRLCPVGWEDVIKIEEVNRKNKADTLLPRLEKTLAHWDEICDAIRLYIPSPDEMAGDLRAAGAPTTPSELGLDEDHFRDALRYARDMRYRYSVLQMIHDLGLDDKFNDDAAAYFTAQK